MQFQNRAGLFQHTMVYHFAAWICIWMCYKTKKSTDAKDTTECTWRLCKSGFMFHSNLLKMIF